MFFICVHLIATWIATTNSFILDGSWRGECYDRIGTCAVQGKEVCTREHETWARQYCPSFCGYCATSASQISHFCTYKNVTYSVGQTWEDGCEFKCRCVDPANNFYICTDYCVKRESRDVDGDCYWGKVPFTCCDVLLCPKPGSGLTGPPGTTNVAFNQW